MGHNYGKTQEKQKIVISLCLHLLIYQHAQNDMCNLQTINKL